MIDHALQENTSERFEKAFGGLKYILPPEAIVQFSKIKTSSRSFW